MLLILLTTRSLTNDLFLRRTKEFVTALLEVRERTRVRNYLN